MQETWLGDRNYFCSINKVKHDKTIGAIPSQQSRRPDTRIYKELLTETKTVVDHQHEPGVTLMNDVVTFRNSEQIP